MLKRLARKHFKKWNGIMLFYIVYNPMEDGKNVFSYMLHPDIKKDQEINDLLKQVADKIRQFYQDKPELLEEVGIEKGEDINKKCEYCNNSRDYMNTMVFGERGEFFIDVNGGLLEVEYNRNLYDDSITDNVDIKINYCPMCGRKL